MCQIFVRNVTDIGAGGGCPQQKSTAGRTFVKNFYPQLRKTITMKNYNYEKLQLQKTATSGKLLMLLGYSCCKNHQQQDLTVFEYMNDQDGGVGLKVSKIFPDLAQKVKLS